MIVIPGRAEGANPESSRKFCVYVWIPGSPAFSGRPGMTSWNSYFPPPFHHRHPKGDPTMVIGITHLQPIVALIAGILILIIPRLLNFIVAAYLIFIGIMGLGIIK